MEIRKECYRQWVRKVNIIFAEEFELYSVDHKELPKISSNVVAWGENFPSTLLAFVGDLRIKLT